MRRAAAQSFCRARRYPLRKITPRTAVALFTSNHALGSRAASSTKTTAAFAPVALQSSMNLRNFSLAFISTLVASGAWYAYKGGNSEHSASSSSTPFGINVTGTSAVQGNGLRTIDIYTPTPDTQSSSVTAEESIQSATKTLQTENDQPLSKSTDDSGQKVVGMLTPEQATQKLRRNEESYFVGRGNGVVRYDVVQLPSNDPIEDDHAEKVVEVPKDIAATSDGAPTSDWMFWGVFDGHS